jgi:hypothetical protein
MQANSKALPIDRRRSDLADLPQENPLIYLMPSVSAGLIRPVMSKVTGESVQQT